MTVPDRRHPPTPRARLHRRAAGPLAGAVLVALSIWWAGSAATAGWLLAGVPARAGALAWTCAALLLSGGCTWRLARAARHPGARRWPVRVAVLVLVLMAVWLLTTVAALWWAAWTVSVVAGVAARPPAGILRRRALAAWPLLRAQGFTAQTHERDAELALIERNLAVLVAAPELGIAALQLLQGLALQRADRLHLTAPGSQALPPHEPPPTAVLAPASPRAFRSGRTL